MPEILERDDSDLSLTTPAATEATPATAVIMCRHRGRSVPGVELLVLFPNKTWKPATTNENGEVQVNLHSTHLPMTVFAAAPSYAAHLKHAWVPDHGSLTIELKSLPNGGAEIFPKGTGHLPGLSGRLNPIRDPLDRTYLHAPEIAVNEGQQQPVPFTPEKDLHLTDAEERELIVRIVEIVGRSALVEHLFKRHKPGPRRPRTLDPDALRKHVADFPDQTSPLFQRRWKMTVKELAELLRKYPDDLQVVVNGYEDGYDDLSLERISVIKIQLNTQNHDWEGQHSDFYGSEKEISDDAEVVEALVFRRRS